MRRRLIRLGLLVLVALAVRLLASGGTPDPDPARPGPSANPAGPSDHDAEARILEAFAEGRSDLLVEIEARVVRLLPDDEEGDRHQRFIVELAGGHTLLVAHNLDLAGRVPVRVGDPVRISGEYEHNARGGVVHWTHRAGGRSHPDGWIEHRGIRYW